MRIGDLFEAKAGGDIVQARSSDVQDHCHAYPIYANGLTEQGLYGFSDYAKEKAGSITVTARGTLGQAFYRDQPFVAIGRLIVLTPKVSLDARYFCEYINYGIQFAVESTGVPQLTAPQISHYLLPIPPEIEQRAIAKVLSDVDGLINALDALIAKKRAIKQATMQQLLTGKTRLPGFSGAWEMKRIGDLLSYKRPDFYIVKSTEYSEHGNIPVLTANKAFILGNHKRYYISEYQNLKLSVPDYEEQRAIAEVLSDIDAEIAALEQRRNKIIAIKQGMMQQLLTGQVRLVKSER